MKATGGSRRVAGLWAPPMMSFTVQSVKAFGFGLWAPPMMSLTVQSVKAFGFGLWATSYDVINSTDSIKGIKRNL